MRLRKAILISAIAALGGVLMIIDQTHIDAVTEAPLDNEVLRARSPAEELQTIQLPPGYHLELVASEPDVICPVLCEWDADGRMYVAEMRSYMLDINGTKAHTPVSRVTRFESTHGDGVYDKHTVFADHLMLPRMVLPLDDRVLIRETDTKDIWCYRDTQNTGVADEKTKFYTGGPQPGNLEHQPAGLVWDIDNWIYVTNQNERFRYTRGKMEKEPLPFHPGQWGFATTDTGQIIFSTAGSENPAHNFQVMPQYGDISLNHELAPGFEAVYPIEHLTDVEGGLPRLRPEGGLNHFTGCAGPSVYSGDALPSDLRGDLIIPEPVGRLVRRAKISVDHGKTVISNAYDKKEFIASTDANFRPVWSATGPDGCLYFCDLYHGIIQEANWTKEGTYLRPQILKYGLQKHIGMGRIWKLVHDGNKPRALPHMLEETSAQLVDHLSDPNGWWRSTAQRLLVLRHDRAVIPALFNLARSDSNPITRLHALWTLEGLDAITDDLLIEKLHDTDPRLREAAVRITEPRLKDDTAAAPAPATAPTAATLPPGAPAGASAAAPVSTVHVADTTAGKMVMSADVKVAEDVKTPSTPPQPAKPPVDPPAVVASPALAKAFRDTAVDPDPEVAGQVCLSALRSGIDDGDAIVSRAAQAPRDPKETEYVKAIAAGYRNVLAKAAEDQRHAAELAKANSLKGELYIKGRDAYGQTCIACHAADGMGMPTPEHDGTTIAPPLRGSRKLLADRQLVARIVLHGLTGPNNGRIYPGQMASFKWADDLWLASILTYARNAWGNDASAIAPQDVAAVRQLTAARSKPFTVDELYTATQETAPVTDTGARVVAAPGEIVLDATTAQLHGSNIHIDCYASGLDVGYWDNWKDFVSWETPPLMPGDYEILARMSSIFDPDDFAVKVGEQRFYGSAINTRDWEIYRDVSVGVIHIDSPGSVHVEVKPRSSERWHPTNIAALRLRPYTGE